MRPPVKGVTAHGKVTVGRVNPDMIVISSNPRLVETPTNQASAYLSNTYDHGQDLRAITDKISRALHDFDSLTQEAAQMSGFYGGFYVLQDNLLLDVTEQVELLEGGQMKSQLKQFVNNYKEMSSKIDSISEERDEVLGSLADWLSTTQIDTYDRGGDDKASFEQEAVRESLAAAKINFSKLARIKEEISHSVTRGRETAHLQTEKERIEKQVLEQVKEYKELSAKETEFEKGQIQQAWKHAAQEICGLLSKVREEGEDNKFELIQQLENLNKMVRNMGNQNSRLEREVREQKYMVKKWEDDSMELTADKITLEHKVKRLKKDLRLTRKSLSRYEVVPKSKIDEEDDEEEQRATTPTVTRPSGQSNAQQKVAQQALETLQSEHKQLEETCEKYEKELAVKENKIEQLESQKSDLLRQMRQANLRPAVRQPAKDTASKLAFSGSVTGISVKSSSSSVATTSGLCEKCGGDMKPVAVASSRTMQAKNLRETSSTTVGPSRGNNGSTKSTAGPRAGGKNGAVDPQQNAQLLKINQDLQTKLAHVQSQITPLRLRIRELEKKVDIPSTETALPVSAETEQQSQHEIQRMMSAEKQQPSASPEDADVSSDTYEAPPKPTLGSQEEVKQPTVVSSYSEFKVKREHGAEKVLCNKGMQTDPRFDPIGAWSKGVDKHESWRPPMPPSKWVDYDPSGPVDAGEGPQAEVNLEKAMLKGTDPTEVRVRAINTANFVQRELERMVDGISGFVEFTHNMVDRETSNMANANRQLKKVLSVVEIERIEKRLSRPLSSKLEGGPSQLDMAIPAGMETGLTGFPSSPITHRDAKMASDMPGYPELSELQQFRESLVPVEDRVKQSISRVAQHAIQLLRRTYDLIYTSLQTQHRQYEQIYTTIQDRPYSSFPLTGIDMDEETGATIRPQKSKSHSDLKSLFQEQGDQMMEGAADIAPLRSRRSLSQANITHPYNLKPAFADSATRRGSESIAAANRQPINVAMATIPKKGLISLTTKPEMKTFQISGDLLIGNKEVAKGRKTRPVPVSHQKLKQKQKDMAKKTKIPLTRNDLKSSDGVRTMERPTQEPADTEFGSYTLYDLERNMEHFAEIAAQEKRQSIFQTLEDQLLYKDISPALPVLADIPTSGKMSAGSQRQDAGTRKPVLPPLSDWQLDLELAKSLQ